MVTYFNKKDLVEFGKYLLSEERKQKFEARPSEEGDLPLEERLSNVYHSDITNWMNKKNE